MAELFHDRRDSELFQRGNLGRDEPEHGSVTVRLLEEIAAEPRLLVHLVSEIEVAAQLENFPALRAGNLAQHAGRLVSRHRLLADRHNVSVPPHLRRLPFTDVKIGSAFLDDDGKKLIDVSHFLTAGYADDTDGELGLEVGNIGVTLLTNDAFPIEARV